MDNQITAFDNPVSTREEILEATYHSLCEYGYADLTIAKIGENFGKSQSLIYHHYDDKDQLLLDLLEYLLENLEDQMPIDEQSADEYLMKLIDRMFSTTHESDKTFSQAVAEMRAQAAHDGNYHQLFRRSDIFVQKQIAHVIRAGVREGVFDVEDPLQSAALFRNTLIGLQSQSVTSEPESIEQLRAELKRYVERCILA